MYESKVEFLNGLTTLLSDQGVIVVSVPVMVGLPFLLQRVGLWSFGLQREPITWRQLVAAVIRCETTELEQDWVPHKHLGFNHRKMMRYVLPEFRVVRQSNEVFQMVYMLRKG